MLINDLLFTVNGKTSAGESLWRQKSPQETRLQEVSGLLTWSFCWERKSSLIKPGGKHDEKTWEFTADMKYIQVFNRQQIFLFSPFYSDASWWNAERTFSCSDQNEKKQKQKQWMWFHLNCSGFRKHPAVQIIHWFKNAASFSRPVLIGYGSLGGSFKNKPTLQSSNKLNKI